MFCQAQKDACPSLKSGKLYFAWVQLKGNQYTVTFTCIRYM
jgi:hypothetical protein